MNLEQINKSYKIRIKELKQENAELKKQVKLVPIDTIEIIKELRGLCLCTTPINIEVDLCSAKRIADRLSTKFGTQKCGSETV